ncbi:MAG: ABC transporter substrate-binding protein [Gammaproteobacteria bacterium]|nr:ABC transporter substrate-binding protein [Gammaproteobacteria bacterium]
MKSKSPEATAAPERLYRGPAANAKRMLLVLLLAAGITMIYFSSGERAPIRIGLMLNLSGHGGTANEYVREGAMLAVEEVNRRGGVKGSALRLLIRDDKNTEEGIRQAARSLIDEGVIAIIGPVTSRNALIAHPEVVSRGVLLFTPYAATRRLAEADDLFFRTIVDTGEHGRCMAVLLRERGATRVAVLKDISNPGFVVEYFEETRRNLDIDYNQVDISSKQPVDWDSVVARLKSAAPDAILLITEVSMTSIATQKLRAQGYTGAIIGTTWTQSPDLIRFGGNAVEGLSLVTFIDPDNQRPEYLKFAEKMRRRLGQSPSARSTRAYEAVDIIATALNRGGEPSTALLREQLLKGSFETLMGRVEFNRFGDVERPMYEIAVREGRFVKVREIP